MHGVAAIGMADLVRKELVKKDLVKKLVAELMRAIVPTVALAFQASIGAGPRVPDAPLPKRVAGSVPVGQRCNAPTIPPRPALASRPSAS